MNYFKVIFLGIVLVVIFINLRKKRTIDRSYHKFFRASFYLTLILLFTISFKLHHLLRSEFNIPNTVTYLFVASLFSLYLIRFIKMITMSNFYLFVISLTGFLLAVVYDLLTDIRILYFSWSDLIEEIFRIIGSLFWLLYFMFYKFKIETK